MRCRRRLLRTVGNERMWAILSGKVTDADYANLQAADRRAVIEILRETKKGLPVYFMAGRIP